MAAQQCAWDGSISSPVKEFVPKPKAGSVRQLTPNPPPYTHPRVLFSPEDREELVQRALAAGSGAGRRAFAAVEKWVQETVYADPASSPVRRLLQVLAQGEPPPSAEAAQAQTEDQSTLPSPSPPAVGEKSPKAVFKDLCALVAGPGTAQARTGAEAVEQSEGGPPAPAPAGAPAPPPVLYGAFYTELFAKGLAPCNLSTALGPIGKARLVVPGQQDTTPELGAMFLFCTSEGGLPYLTSPIYRALQEAAYVAWIREEGDKLAWLGRVLSMAARVHLLWYAVPRDELSKHSGSPPGYNSPDETYCPHLALAYDTLHASLAEGDRVWPRRLLLSMGKRRVMSGFDSQSWRYFEKPGLSHVNTTGTFGVMTSLLLLVQYAAEGESVPGQCDEDGKEHPALAYDEEAAHLNAEGVKFWLTHGAAWDPTGTSRECPGYFGTAMRMGAFPALAAARRGYDICGGSYFYNVVMEILQTSVQWYKGTLCLGSHDGGGYCGGFGQSEYFIVLKYLFSGDPLVEYLWQKVNTNLKGEIGDWGINKMPIQSAMLAMDVRPEEYPLSQAAREAGLPLSFFSNCRGMGTARSDWGDGTGTLLWFESRPDAYSMGHFHSDRNDFYLASHGRVWVAPGIYHNTEPEAHSTVLIDGVGQGGCHTSAAPAELSRLWSLIPGKVVETFDSTLLTAFVGDATVAYTYTGDGPQRPSDDFNKKMPLRPPFTWREFFTYPPDFGPSLVLDKASKSPKWVRNDSWADTRIHARAEFNPVQYAYRTAGLVRMGSTPFALIVDDIRKDDQEHSWTWTANTSISFLATGWPKPISMLPPEDFGLDPLTEAMFARGEDMEEGATSRVKPRSPLLLLRLVHAMGVPAGPIRLVHVPKGFPEKLDCATYREYERIEIERRGCVEPAFKVLLFPFLEGDLLPRVTYDALEGELTVEAGAHLSIIRMEKDGPRTRLRHL